MTVPVVSKHTLEELLTIAVPVIISQGALAVMLFTDRYFMSLIDTVHISASLGGGLGAFLCLSLFIGTLAYTNALVAQYLGANELRNCSKVVTQGVIASLIFAPIVLVAGYFVSDIFELFGHEARLIYLERKYFYVLIFGALFTFVKLTLASFFIGVGRTYHAMIVEVAGALFNIPLSYVLVFGGLGFPALGIAGAALGTILSTILTTLLFLSMYFHNVNRSRFAVLKSFEFDSRIMRRFVRLGLPIGAERSLNIIAFNVFLLMFQSYGAGIGAAIAIVFNWDFLRRAAMMGLSIGVMSFVGRAIGARDIKKVSAIIRAGFIVGFMYAILIAAVYILFRDPLVELFLISGVDGDAIRALASSMFIGMACYVIADALMLVSGGVLRGVGDTQWIMWVSVSLHWAMLLVQFFVIKVWLLDPIVSFGIYIAMMSLVAAAYLFRLRSSVWRNPEALDRLMSG